MAAGFPENGSLVKAFAVMRERIIGSRELISYSVGLWQERSFGGCKSGKSRLDGGNVRENACFVPLAGVFFVICM